MNSKPIKLNSKTKVFKIYFDFIYIKKLGDITGETFNFDGKGSTDAVAYGKGSNGGYTVKDSNHFFKPQMVSKLPGRMAAPKPGPIEVVDEVKLN